MAGAGAAGAGAGAAGAGAAGAGAGSAGAGAAGAAGADAAGASILTLMSPPRPPWMSITPVTTSSTAIAMSATTIAMAVVPPPPPPPVLTTVGPSAIFFSFSTCQTQHSPKPCAYRRINGRYGHPFLPETITVQIGHRSVTPSSVTGRRPISKLWVMMSHAPTRKTAPGLLHKKARASGGGRGPIGCTKPDPSAISGRYRCKPMTIWQRLVLGCERMTICRYGYVNQARTKPANSTVRTSESGTARSQRASKMLLCWLSIGLCLPVFFYSLRGIERFRTR